MTTELESLNKARRRIRTAYDPALLRSAGHRLADLLGEHLAKIEGCGDAVLNWEDPRRNVDKARGVLEGNAGNPNSEIRTPQFSSAQFGELVQLMLNRGHNLHDPRYIGHQVPASIPIAGLFDAVGSVTNQVMAIYEMGPWASAVEEAMVEKLGEQIGWKRDEFAGVITHGGSLANTTALLTARNVSLGNSWEQGIGSDGPQPVLVAHGETHYCIARSAGILGLGTNNVIRAELDEGRRIEPNKLDETLKELRKENRPIMAVSACACATPIGAFDPLEDIADVCHRHDVWMHVDAAHGGAACFSRRYRHLVSGLERADSLIWDAHKMLFANLRPIKPHDCLIDSSPLKRHLIEGVDILFLRELTGGIYFGESGRNEHPSGEEAYNVMSYSTEEILRIVRLAAEAAKTRRGKLTSVDKANVLEVSRLWRQVAAKVMTEEYPDLEYEVVLVDAMAMHLISRPADFDVVVTGNMFGDILTDEGSMLPGSLGLLPSASLGDSGPGLYEPIHGTAPDIAGQGIANPLATILAAAMLLSHSLGLKTEAAAIETAVESVLNAGHRTADIAAGGASVSTREMGSYVVEALKAE